MAEPSAAWVVRRPAPAPAHVVERYIACAPGIHRGLPSRHQTFIVSIGPQGDAPWERRFAIVDEVLTRLVADDDPVEPALRRWAHLNRDVPALAGCTPGELLAGEDVPSFQDERAADAAA